MTLRHLPLAALNSATKYPSIATYHDLGDKGRLVDSDPPGLDGYGPSSTPLYVTEKVDGTNARILVGPAGDEAFIGSRENLLHYLGDVCHDPAMGIVDGLKRILRADHLDSPPNTLTVYYGEFYGHKVGAAAKQYTGGDACGFCLFDVATYGMGELLRLVDLPAEQIASWRESGGQRWADVEALPSYGFPTVPRRDVWHVGTMPRSVPATAEWLAQYRGSLAALDGEAGGIAEGVVARTADRRYIRKIRFEDYARTLRGRS